MEQLLSKMQSAMNSPAPWSESSTRNAAVSWWRRGSVAQVLTAFESTHRMPGSDAARHGSMMRPLGAALRVWARLIGGDDFGAIAAKDFS